MSLPSPRAHAAGRLDLRCAACPRLRLSLDFLCGICSKLWARKPKEFVQRQKEWLALREIWRGRARTQPRRSSVNGIA